MMLYDSSRLISYSPLLFEMVSIGSHILKRGIEWTRLWCAFWLQIELQDESPLEDDFLFWSAVDNELLGENHGFKTSGTA